MEQPSPRFRVGVSTTILETADLLGHRRSTHSRPRFLNWKGAAAWWPTPLILSRTTAG